MELTKESWNEKDYHSFLTYLLTLKDEKNSLFTKRLVTTSKEILGIKLPILRQIAKEIGKGNIESFLEQTTNKYHEEILIEGFVISQIKDPVLSRSYLKDYLLKIDNWATCDSFCSSYKIVKKNKEKYYPFVLDLVKDDKTYHIRVGLVLLLNYYVEDAYLDSIFKVTNRMTSDEYYVKMAVAWLLSICYIKNREKTKKYFTYHQLSPWTYQKTLQKIIESTRTTKEEKEYFRKIKKECVLNKA